MRRQEITLKGWCLVWKSENRIDGISEHPIIYDGPPHGLFRTRREAREHLKEKYAYLETRPDLRSDPHGWKMPRVEKATLTLQRLG